MSSPPPGASRAVALLVAAIWLCVWSPSDANASHRTLGRAVGNIAQAPLDIVLSPIVSWAVLNRNIQDIDDTPGVRLAYYVPGYFWMTGVQVGAAVLRGITGGLELIPGIFLLPFKDADLDILYDPVDRGEGLVEWENGIIDIKFGINYQSPSY